jgi:cell division protein FtsZ
MSIAKPVGKKKIPAKIKIVGVGGGGTNAINHMYQFGISGVEFIAANTDAQHLETCLAPIRLQLGPGDGAGGEPEIARQFALADREKIKEFIHGTDMIFLTGGMGGGTYTGASPVIGEIAMEMGILTVAVATLPFEWEGEVRMQYAQWGMDELKKNVDSYIVIPNERLYSLPEYENMTVMDGFKVVDRVLHDSVSGIVELITRPGHINRDISDVKKVLRGKGQSCVMSIGKADGEKRAEDAFNCAINNPLLSDTPIDGAEKVLINVVHGKNFRIPEHKLVMNLFKSKVSQSAHILPGIALDESLGDFVKVTIIATGIDKVVDLNECDPSVLEVIDLPEMSHPEVRKVYEPHSVMADNMPQTNPSLYERMHSVNTATPVITNLLKK